MSSTSTGSGGAPTETGTGVVDMKLEAVVIPVADVERAKQFYGGLGWRLDADFPFDNGFRVVQFTPPGSGCSIQFGTKMTSVCPSRTPAGAVGTSAVAMPSTLASRAATVFASPESVSTSIGVNAPVGTPPRSSIFTVS